MVEQNDCGGKKDLWLRANRAVKGLQTVCEFCSVAVLAVSESYGDVCLEAICFYCQEWL